MQFRLVKETLPNGQVRFFTQSRKDDNGHWYLVMGTYSDMEDEAVNYFNRCIELGEDSVREILKIRVQP